MAPDSLLILLGGTQKEPKSRDKGNIFFKYRKSSSDGDQKNRSHRRQKAANPDPTGSRLDPRKRLESLLFGPRAQGGPLLGGALPFP